MRIQLKGRNNLFTFRNAQGELSSVNLADFTGKINFRKIIREYLKGEGVFIATRTTILGPSQFLVLMGRPLVAIDVLKIALKLRRRGES